MPIPSTKNTTMLRWLATVYRWRRQQYSEAPRPGRQRPGPQTFTLAQAKAIGTLARWLGFSISEISALLKQKPNLCRAVRLRRAPGRWWCWRAQRCLTQEEKLEIDLAKWGCPMED